MNVTHLYCSNCAEKYEPNKIYNLCEKCSKPLLCEYDLEKAAATLTRESLKTRINSLWRYAEVLPVENEKTSSASAKVSRRCTKPKT
jgi:threonine synthase